jgi:chromosome partitioning protein
MLQSALVASDYLITPIFAEADALDGLVDLFDEFHEIQKTYNPNLKFLGLFITRFDSKSSTHKKFSVLLKQWCEKSSVKLFDSIITQSNAVASARTAEKSVISYSPNLPVAEAYSLLTQEIDLEIKKNMKLQSSSKLPEISGATADAFEEAFDDTLDDCMA